nr:MAG TPA: hypothetical protein [Caudoviricetes sp.]
MSPRKFNLPTTKIHIFHTQTQISQSFQPYPKKTIRV